jgi:hypothetical protein
MRGYLLMGTRATDGGGRKNHGKPASPPTELGANKTSYASAKIGDQDRCFSSRAVGVLPPAFAALKKRAELLGDSPGA